MGADYRTFLRKKCQVKKLCIVLCLPFLIQEGVMAQKRYTTDKGELYFVSNAELEVIKASSTNVKGVIVPESNQFAFSVSIPSFQGFNGDLQRVHFMENYMESDQYPKATFAGKIIEQVDFTQDGTYEVRAKGELDIHGQKQIRIIKSKVIIKNGIVYVESHFTVPLADHSISIPKIINRKIATEINVTLKAFLTPSP
jgi:hypothetical protein